jgi:apolipoprotein N-acyltransferase
LRGTVLPRSGATPYLYVGNYPVVLLCGMLAGLAAWLRRRLGRAGNSPPGELSAAHTV